VSTEILTLVLTGIAVWLAFKYINRDEEHSWRKKVIGWSKGLNLGYGSKERMKVWDPESSRKVELRWAT
jgi:hypothetical protein